MKTLFETKHFLALALTTLVAPAGCDLGDGEAADDFGAGEVSERCVGCGVKFNTFAFGKLDGGELDRRGDEWAGAKLISVELACSTNEKDIKSYPKACLKNTYFTLEEVWAEHGELYGRRDGLLFHGGAFLHSRWTIDLFVEGNYANTHVQTIEKYEYNPQQKPHALHYYTFMFKGDGSNGGEKGQLTPACTEDTDPITGQVIGTKSIVYENITVDTKSGVISERKDTLYIACVSAAVGKAGDWGFLDWEIGHEDFTTAVRTVRADYCADGQSWTKKGTALQVADVWQYSGFANPNAVTEAIWGEKGALCLDTPRLTSVYSYNTVKCFGEPVKPCDGAKLGNFPEAIIWTKLP